MNREKIIKGLECCLTLDSPCGDCPYYSYEDIQELDCERNLRHDVITLLKEQESEIRQLRLALDIAKGTCNGIKSGGGQFADMPTMQSTT